MRLVPRRHARFTSAPSPASADRPILRTTALLALLAPLNLPLVGCSGAEGTSDSASFSSSGTGESTTQAATSETAAPTATVVWELSTAQGPAARFDFAMATLGDAVVLFGGKLAEKEFLGDTWLFDGDAWTELMIDGPEPRGDFGMTAWNGAVWLYGGVGADPDQGITRFRDLWRFDGAAWAQIEADAPPGPRNSFALAASDAGIVLTSGIGESSAYITDSWAYDGAWTQLPEGPGKRRSSIGVSLAGAAYVLGGATPAPSEEVWVSDGATWTQAEPLPYGIAYPYACPLGDTILTFGGIVTSTTPSRLAALWGPGGSTQIDADPSARSQGAATGLGDRCLLFGGIGESGLLAETWIAHLEP